MMAKFISALDIR